MLKTVFTILLCLSFFSPVYAQENDTEAPNGGPRKQIATVIYAGLGGAVLGLSTLSFHGRPQDHLGSIAGGFALGIIVGAIISSYSVATEPDKLYGGYFDEMENIKFRQNAKHATALSYAWSF